VGEDQRWPFADRDFGGPVVRPRRASTSDATLAMRDQFYLDELARQARIFTESFADAMDAALVRNDAEATWRHIQGALFAAIIVSRIVHPTSSHKWDGVTKSGAEAIAKARAARIRALVLLPPPDGSDVSIYHVSDLRDPMEHIDERLDWATHPDRDASIADWYLASDLVSLKPVGLRAFVPVGGILFFGTESINLFQLDLDMLGLLNNIAEARVALAKRIVGPFEYGPMEMRHVATPEARREALLHWEGERALRLAALAEAEGGARASGRS